MTEFDRALLALNDTAPDAERVQLQLLREKTPSERAALALGLTSQVIRAAKRAIARAHPEFTERQVGHKFIELSYGPDLADAVRQYEERLEDAGTE